MSSLLDSSPYSDRNESAFLEEMNALVDYHRGACEPYARIVGEASTATCVEDLPYVHVGLFKRMDLASRVAAPGVAATPGRTVLSSSTSGQASRIFMDEITSRLQSRSSEQILGAFVGTDKRPLLVLDSVSSLRRRDDFSARILAAMSLKPFASEVFFLLKDPADARSFQFGQLECALKQPGPLLVYGFSWMLWQGWAQLDWPGELLAELRSRPVTFVHSGGWKKLEAERVNQVTFDATLMELSGAGSKVVDYYGLVEQMGIVFPLCEHGSRHVPRWADVIVRNTWSMEPLATEVGQLQLLNTLAHGTPCHSVLTEDMGRLLPGPCACGRGGRRFELIGRVPKAEVRGCSNVG